MSLLTARAEPWTGQLPAAHDLAMPTHATLTERGVISPTLPPAGPRAA